MSLPPLEESPAGADSAALPSFQPAKRSKDRLWILALAVFDLVLITTLIYFSPRGVFGKLWAFGYAVCHQISSHSFQVNGTQFPLCARCTGTYLGALLSLTFHFAQGRKAKFPPIGISIALGLLFLAFALDGSNSFAQMFPRLPKLYDPGNTLRLLTGLGAGLGIGAVLSPVFAQAVWKDQEDSAALNSWPKFLLLLGMAAVLAALLLFGPAWLLYIAAGLSGLAIPIVLSIIYTVLAVIVLKREGQILRWQELALPALMGLGAALTQFALTDLARYLLTHTWLPPNL